MACSEWTGVRLKDVLEAAGVQDAAVYTGHEGADVHLSGDPEMQPISRGLPIEKALDDDVLIAFEMNGGPIHPMNGAPLRLVVPGWPGSCSQKWLTRIWVRDQVHDGEKMGGQSYRVPAYPVAPGTDVPNEDMVIMGAMPVKSIVTFPANGNRDGAFHGCPRGGAPHAWVGDRTIERLEVSIDFGATWTEAELDAPVNRGAWQNWRTNVSFPQSRILRDLGQGGPIARASRQPHAIAWNPRGATTTIRTNPGHRRGWAG